MMMAATHLPFHYVMQGLFVLTGLVALWAAIGNWKWFFSTANARRIEREFGRGRMRLFYGVIGFFLIATGVFFFFYIRETV